MPKYCMKCGTQLPEGVKFCPNCGTDIIEEQTINPPEQNQNNYQQPMSQTQTYVQSAKPKNMMLFGIIAVVVILIVIIGVFFIFMSGDDDSDNTSSGGSGGIVGDGTFIGTWTVTSMTMNDESFPVTGVTITINEDGTYTTSAYGETQTGTWSTGGGELSLIDDDSISSETMFGDTGMTATFTNGGNTLTLDYSSSIMGESYTMQIVMTKS